MYLTRLYSSMAEKMGRIAILWLLLFGGSLSTEIANASTQEDQSIVIRGTLNAVLANANGMVVVTDSMQTWNSTQLPDPGKKLFQIDRRTICTIAGFGSEQFTSAPEFNTSAAGIIERYEALLAGQGDVHPFAEKLTSLAHLFQFNLSSTANLSHIVNPPTLDLNSHFFQLILAGYDTDGAPKIAKLTLQVSITPGRDGQPTLSSIAENVVPLSVAKTFIYLLAGQHEVAERILSQPQNFMDDPAIHRYAESRASDSGSSLTLPELKALAESLVRHTEQKHRTVGGERQFAILSKGKEIALEQRSFPKYPLPVPEFFLLVGSHFENCRKSEIRSNFLVVRNKFLRCVQKLDGNYFFGNEFIESLVQYDGGPMRFDRSNIVVGSTLLLGPHVDQNPDAVKKLRETFDWRSVRYESKREPEEK